jgi:hypothetical protein
MQLTLFYFVRTCSDIPGRMLFISSSGLENAKRLITSYKKGHVNQMTPELWRAKQIVDSTLHPGMSKGQLRAEDRLLTSEPISDTGEAVFLPFRMSCFVLSNLVVTAGMLTPGLQVQYS